MENLKRITESKHDELLSLLNPLIDFMNENEYSYFFVAGKEGLCSRYLKGTFGDITGMIFGMMETNEQVEDLFEYIIEKRSNCPKCGGYMTGDGTKS